MPSLNSVFVVKWRVDNGPPKAVQYDSSFPYQVYIPDGAVMTDTQTIIDFIMKQDPKQQPDLLVLARQGPLTLAPAAQSKFTIPPIPAA